MEKFTKLDLDVLKLYIPLLAAKYLVDKDLKGKSYTIIETFDHMIDNDFDYLIDELSSTFNLDREIVLANWDAVYLKILYQYNDNDVFQCSGDKSD